MHNSEGFIFTPMNGFILNKINVNINVTTEECLIAVQSWKSPLLIKER